MAPTSENMRNIAEQAERDLNTYEAKTGAGRGTRSDEAGVDPMVENKFPGAEVKYDTELSTNASYNKRIPPSEGGETDARGRQTRGEHFEKGVGSGPQEKLARQQRDFGGYNEYELDPADKRRPGNDRAGVQAASFGQSSGDPLRQGREAVESNVAGTTRNPKKDHVKGSEYYTPESVPGSISAESNEPPESVVQASRESENY
ncbi:hypothetical protein DL764_009579 [Monosporascus ibericus]|uniref:Uncharacterized protein n=1 Tax=Monosporascus ibericus TaxID=155417 RepID=A0A4Q4SWP5_9PEZI|nr:hypothetical protein DL764_009579 [Monosporascus ibericus]